MADRAIEDIKGRLDIVDVLSGYIQVRKAGTNFKAVCPFHNEKSPSLIISPAKQIWHCFGCNEGGDIFSFVKRIESLDFREALQILASRAGVILPEFSPQDKRAELERELLVRINKFAAAFFHQQLKTAKAKAATEYLSSRGLSPATLEQWQIGFAPAEFHALEQALRKHSVAESDLLKAGVSVKGEKGGIYDRFRNRITFPIFNYVGEIVGFSARILESDPNAAKYVNSPETAIYNKSAILFGLNFAKSDIRKLDSAVLVEGQMDCISCHQAGFTNTVATSGTALTEQHLRALGRLTHNLIFCFDADSAGQQASKRAGLMALQNGFSVRVVSLPKGKDPDELIRQDPSAWKKALIEAVWFVDHFITLGLLEFKPGTVEQKQYVSKTLVPMVQLLHDPIERDHYVQKIIDTFSVGERAMRSSFMQTSGKFTSTSTDQDTQPVTASTFVNPLEKLVLGCLVALDQLPAATLELLHPEDFTDPETRLFVEAVLKASKVPNELKDTTLAKEAQFMVESQLDSGGESGAILSGELHKNLFLLRLSNVKRQQELLVQHMKQAEVTKDLVRLQQLRMEFAELTAARLDLENKINEN